MGLGEVLRLGKRRGRGEVIKKHQFTLIRKETVLIFVHFWFLWESLRVSPDRCNYCFDRSLFNVQNKHDNCIPLEL